MTVAILFADCKEWRLASPAGLHHSLSKQYRCRLKEQPREKKLQQLISHCVFWSPARFTAARITARSPTADLHVRDVRNIRSHVFSTVYDFCLFIIKNYVWLALAAYIVLYVNNIVVGWKSSLAKKIIAVDFIARVYSRARFATAHSIELPFASSTFLVMCSWLLWFFYLS